MGIILLLSFTENQVDYEALKQLEEGEITELIPLVGPRTKFKAQWRKWKEELEILKKNSEILVSIDFIFTCFTAS